MNAIFSIICSVFFRSQTQRSEERKDGNENETAVNAAINYLEVSSTYACRQVTDGQSYIRQVDRQQLAISNLLRVSLT